MSLSRNEFLPCGIPQVKGCTTACVLFRFGSRWSQRPQMKGHVCVSGSAVIRETYHKTIESPFSYRVASDWLMSKLSRGDSGGMWMGGWTEKIKQYCCKLVFFSSSRLLVFPTLVGFVSFYFLFFTLPRSVKWLATRTVIKCFLLQKGVLLLQKF